MPRPKRYLPTEKEKSIAKRRLEGKTFKQIAQEDGSTEASIRSLLTSYHTKLSSLSPHWSDGLSPTLSLILREHGITPEEVCLWGEFSSLFAGQYDKLRLLRVARQCVTKKLSPRPTVSPEVLRALPGAPSPLPHTSRRAGNRSRRRVDFSH